MSDLIKRSDAIKAIEELPNAYNGWSDAYDKAYIISTLEEVPKAEITADDVLEYCRPRLLAIVAEEALHSADRPQGEWIDYIGYDLGIKGQWLRDDGKTVFVQCDQCDSILVRNLMTHMNFCPNCGARMKGATNERR